MSEREYYTNSPYVNYCKWKGYEEREEREDVRFRNVAYVIYCGNTDRKNQTTIEKFWPLPSDKKASGRDTIIITKEWVEKIKKAHNLKKWKT